MKKMKKSLILLAFLLFVFFLSCNVYAGEQSWNALDYNVVLNEDGSADIVETWDVSIKETNTLFKDFNLSSDDNYYITDVKVDRIISDEVVPLTQIYQQQYHVDSGCYYGLMIDRHTYEIAWNVGLDNSSANRVYKISYKVNNAVKVYEDCSEFYWQFLSSDNTMTGNNVTGTITLPNGITDIEKLHIWGHGDFSGNTERNSTSQVSFDLSKLYANSMLEIRVVSEDNVFETASNVYYGEKLSSILEEEARWAEEANAKREFWVKVVIIALIVCALVFIFYITRIVKYIRAGKELKMQAYPKNEFKYFREIPNEPNATPARAAYMYYFAGTSSGFSAHTANIFSATLLQLTLKKYISLEPINKKNVKINVLNNENTSELAREEQLIYDFIVAHTDTTNSVETETLEKYAKKHYDEFHSLMDKVCKAAENYESQNSVVDTDKKSLVYKWNGKAAAYVFGIWLGIFVCSVIPLALPIIIEFLICMILCFRNAGRINVLSPKAYEEVNRWKGLKNYMSDFSLLKEKEVPDLILWEKYLVYATTFGISKKVLEQLIKVYPQMTSDEYYRSGHYTYLYIASNSGFDSLSSLDQSLGSICRTANSAYSSAHSSSSGGGGGFSGGGGGRRRRR